MSLRNIFWHQLEPSAKTASIRLIAGGHNPFARETGPCPSMNITESVASQLAWLGRERPRYLLTYPSGLANLLRTIREDGTELTGLEKIQTIGEVVTPELRSACLEVLGASIIDTYSTVEAGVLALQCPAHEHYHVMSEGVLLEVLNRDGQRCREGEVGRVVVTPLHNFAAPLIRYAIDDYAEVGPPCPCQPCTTSQPR